MKIGYRLFAIACLTAAGLAACGTDNAPVDTTDTDTASQTTVVRYTSKDIAALPIGEFLNFDLTRPNTVFALTYSNPADLDHVLVHHSSGDSVLSDQLPAAKNLQGDTFGPREVVVGDDVDDGGGSTVCNCPCCQLVDGVEKCCR